MAIGNRHGQLRWYVLENAGIKYEVQAFNREQARGRFRVWLHNPGNRAWVRRV